MNRTSPVMIENHEDEYELEGNRWDDEEIGRNEVHGVIVEKGLPRLGGRFPLWDHVLGDRCLRHRNAEFQEFAMHARRSPARIGEAHLTDQIPNFIGCRGSSFRVATLPGPIESKPLAMPGDNGLRFDKEQC